MDWIRLAKAVGCAVGVMGAIIGLVWLADWIERHDAGWIVGLGFGIVVLTVTFYLLLGGAG
jgi:hypothetical protein